MHEKMLEEQVEFQKKGLAREPRASGMQVRGQGSEPAEA